MEISTISFFMFLVSYVLLFIGVLFMVFEEELSPKMAVILLIGGFPVFTLLSVLTGVLFKALLI